MSNLTDDISDLSIRRNIINQLNELKSKGEYEEGNWLLQQSIYINNKLDNQILLMNQLFQSKFGSIPKTTFISGNDVLVLLAPYQYKLLNAQFPSRVDNFIESLGTKRIFLKIYSDTLGELLINLFSHIQYVNMLDIKTENVYDHPVDSSIFKRETLRVYLKIKDNRMPIALGKQGGYIHFVNKFMESIHFRNEHLDKMIEHIQIYLRSE
jgi:hypothetical protein